MYRLCSVLFLLALSAAAPSSLAAKDDIDPRAIDYAKSLKRKGEEASQVAALLTKQFRLDPAGLSAAMTAAQYSASQIADALRRQRVGAKTAVAALRHSGHRAEETAPATMAAYRLSNAETAQAMQAGGYTINDIARGLRRAIKGSDDQVVMALEKADFSREAVQQTAIRVLNYAAIQWIRLMRQDGSSAIEAGSVLKDNYGQGPNDGASNLLAAGYRGVPVGQALRQVWDLDAAAAQQTFIAVGFQPNLSLGNEHPLWRLLENAGYPMPSPTLISYHIAGYRPGLYDEPIENFGVLDRDKTTAPSDPSDGEVYVLVIPADLDHLVATLGGTSGEILQRQAQNVTHQGSTLQGEQLHIRFRDFDSGQLVLDRLGRSDQAPALALGYHVIERTIFETGLAGLSLTLGNPTGSGQMVLGGDSSDIEVPTHRQGGLTVDVDDMSSNAVGIETIATDQANAASLELTLGFETSGAEIAGVFLEYIPVWTCGSFQVPVADCGTANIPCLLGALGIGIASLGSCTNPANWQEQEVADGPGIPFEADLTAPQLRIAVAIAPEGSGPFAAGPVTAEFSAGISLRTVIGAVDMELIEAWIFEEVNASLQESVDEMELGPKVVEPLNNLRNILGWGHIIGTYPLTEGRLFVDAKF